MELASKQLDRLFSVSLPSGAAASPPDDGHASSLCDISIAYGLLLKEGVMGDTQHLCDQLSQEVSVVE